MAEDTLDHVADDVALDADSVRANAESVLKEDLYWFPVRHHSPAVARHVESAILERKPKLVFIEGPSEANDLVQHVVDSKTRPPVAIYSSYRDDDNALGLAGIESPSEDVPARFACWYPMLAYSPEYVAMRAARKIGSEVVFMDLPHYGQIRSAAQQAGALDDAKPQADDNGALAPEEHGESARGHQVQREDDRLIIESGFYQALAREAGYRTWEEAWDSLFEFGRLADDREAFREEMAVFCAAARATASPQRMQMDFTRERERFMIRCIRETLGQRKLPTSDAMVVCGGFHLFLDRDDPEPPPELPPGTVYTTVVPYSFFRVSELSGYASGNRAPQFYQLHWDLSQKKRGEDLLAEHTVAVLNRARREGEALSSADAIAVTQHARLLARLRGRATPVLDDIHDALITCCCKGDPEDDGLLLRRAMDAVDIGTKVGRVTPALGRLPLVNDFYAQISDLDLGEVMGKEKRLTMDLDKRDDLAASRSVFLHRLRYMEIPIGQLVDAPTDFATGTIFRERWALQWSPKIEPELVEQNLYGDSIESAVISRLHEDLARDEQHAGKTCQRLVWAIDMDLPNLIREVEDKCSMAIDNDTRFVSLSQALRHLNVIDRYAVYHNLRRQVLADLIERCFDRACFAIPDVSSVPEQQQEEVVEALKSLAEIVLGKDSEDLDADLFAQHVRSAAAMSTVPFLRGVFLGTLTEMRYMTPEDLALEVANYASSPPEKMIEAGDLLDGIMAVSRTSILLGADALIGAIDDLLRAAEWNAFLTMIPKLRAAFERLHARQCDSLAARVAKKYGLAEDESLTELRTSVGAAAVIARIDRQVAEVMKEWEF